MTTVQEESCWDNVLGKGAFEWDQSGTWLWGVQGRQGRAFRVDEVPGAQAGGQRAAGAELRDRKSRGVTVVWGRRWRVLKATVKRPRDA